jgi:hypothetical protein
VSAGLSLLLAPRVAGSRRAALSRLRARGAASGAFAGTPCSAPGPSETVAVAGREAAAAPPGEDAASCGRDAAPAGDRAAAGSAAPSVASDPKEDA